METNPGIIDLTKPLGRSTEIFKDGAYSDPEFEITEWSSIDSHGFRVSFIRIGTQTGTHIDAPAHFNPSGDCLEMLELSELMGSYYLVDLGKYNNDVEIEELCNGYGNEKILFIRAYESSMSALRTEALDILLALPPVVWILDGHIEVIDREKYGFHRILAESGKYLVEDIDSQAAGMVRPGGEIFAFPLRLEDASGSPCRVFVRMRIDE